MAKITLEEQPEFLTFPVDSIVELKVEECTVKTQQGQRGDWQKVEFKFKILGVQALGNGADPSTFDSMITETIWGSVPFRLTDSPENKLRMWAEALFGMELGLGFELDTDMFVGRVCRGLTSQYEAKAKDAQGNPFKRHQIETLLPKAGGTPAPQQMQQAPAQQWGGTPAPQQAPAPQAPVQDPWATSAQQQGWGSGEEPPF